MKPISQISVQELRQMARLLHSEGKLSLRGLEGQNIGRWIADANKTDLVNRLIDSGVATTANAPDSKENAAIEVHEAREDATGEAAKNKIANGNGNGNGSKPDLAGKSMEEIVYAIADHVSKQNDEGLAQNVLDVLEGIEQRLAERPAAAAAAREVVVKVADLPEIKTGFAHKIFELANSIINGAGCHLYLVGPTGSGKSHLAGQIAEVQAKINGWSEARFFPYSTGRETSRFDLLGYMDANGNYIKGILREPFENGGLLLLDEIDSGSPAVLTVLNAALANGHCSFPDAVVKRHKDFRCIAAANTWGNGYDSEYVGRNKIDAATLNRFVQLEMPYDLKLEAALASDSTFCELLQLARRAIFELKIKHILSPRQVIDGCKLLAAGVPKRQVAELIIWRDLDDATRKKIQAKMKELSNAPEEVAKEAAPEVEAAV